MKDFYVEDYITDEEEALLRDEIAEEKLFDDSFDNSFSDILDQNPMIIEMFIAAVRDIHDGNAKPSARLVLEELRLAALEYFQPTEEEFAERVQEDLE